LFEERLEIFVKLLDGTPVTWSGKTRSPLRDQLVFPPIEHGRLQTWAGVGGSPESVVRAARHGLPLTLAIIGGSAKRFLPFVDLYKKSLARFGKPALPIAAHSPGHVAATDAQAKAELWPHYAAMINRIGRERGWPPRTRDHFEIEAGPDGALYVGSPETVATKIVATVKALGLARFDLKYSNGTMPHDQLISSIELIGTKVAPRVREILAGDEGGRGMKE
jgi:alkanesulfonate monooxygenase SsuD/methylene tetrahydromethanopterin reductase-like flavin-dependent oxidoreductase (luciferase family)